MMDSAPVCPTEPPAFGRLSTLYEANPAWKSRRGSWTAIYAVMPAAYDDSPERTAYAGKSPAPRREPADPYALSGFGKVVLREPLRSSRGTGYDFEKLTDAMRQCAKAPSRAPRSDDPSACSGHSVLDGAS
jgi:hypothetical protein